MVPVGLEYSLAPRPKAINFHKIRSSSPGSRLLTRLRRFLQDPATCMLLDTLIMITDKLGH